MSETNISKKIITYDAIERYHDKLEQHISDDYLKKTDYKEAIMNGIGSYSLIRNSDHYSLAIGEGAIMLGASTMSYTSIDEIYDSLGVQTIDEGWFETKTFAMAIGDYSKVYGMNCFCAGVGGTAEGVTTYCKGFGHAEGNNTISYNNFAHSEGNNAIAWGFGSHAEGTGTQITYSELLSLQNGVPISILWKNNYNIAYGGYSHVEGCSNLAFGTGAHAEGNNAIAWGFGSHAEGHGTIANNDYEHAQGTYNNSLINSTLFSIGFGTSDTDRFNAIEVTRNGDVYIFGIGNYYGIQSSTPGIQSDVATVISRLMTSVDDLNTDLSQITDEINNMKTAYATKTELNTAIADAITTSITNVLNNPV